MKKHLFGIFAIVLAIGFSAFTASPKKAAAVDTFWFEVDLNDVGSTSQVATADATFLIKNDGSVPSGPSCNTGSYYCLIAFTDPDKVTDLGEEQYEINGSQYPDITQATRTQ